MSENVFALAACYFNTAFSASALQTSAWLTFVCRFSVHSVTLCKISTVNRWISLIAILFSGTTGVAQLRFSNINDVLNYADRHSTVARHGNLNRQVREEEVGLVRAGLLPKLNVFGTAEYALILPTQVIPESAFGGQDGKFRKVQFGMPLNFSSGVEFTLPLLNFEKWAQLEKAKLQSAETSWSQKALLESLHIQITQWYFQALVSKEMARLNAENIQVVNELMRILEERKRRGILEPADYNRSRNLQLNVEAAQRDYNKAWNECVINLRALLNTPGAVSLELTESIASFEWPVNDLNATIISHRPAWNEATARTEVAKQFLIESKKAALPELSLSSRYLYNWQMNNAQNIHFDVSTVGVRLDYNLFNGGYHRRQQKKADLSLQSAYLQQQQTESALIQQQQEWWNNYTNAFSKKIILQDKVSIATDNLRIARLNLKEGVMEFDAFNNIFSEYIRAQIEQLQNLSDGILYHLLITNNIK